MIDTHVYLLGAMRIERNGRCLTGIRSQKALALLGYLAIEARPVARTTLAAMFWGDEPETKARRELRRVIYNLTTLMPGCLVAERQVVRFDLTSHLWLDVTQFAALSKDNNPDNWLLAADLYQGELMEGLYLNGCPRFETWLLGKREYYQQQAFRVFQQLITSHCERLDFATAVTFAQRCLTIDPWREETHRQLMMLLARTGQYSAALKQFEKCRAVLAAELGVEPSPETVKLHTRIKSAMVVSNRKFPNDAEAPAIIQLRQLLEGLLLGNK